MIETAGPERMVHLEQALALAPNGVWAGDDNRID